MAIADRASYHASTPQGFMYYCLYIFNTIIANDLTFLAPVDWSIIAEDGKIGIQAEVVVDVDGNVYQFAAVYTDADEGTRIPARLFCTADGMSQTLSGAYSASSPYPFSVLDSEWLSFVSAFSAYLEAATNLASLAVTDTWVYFDEESAQFQVSMVLRIEVASGQVVYIVGGINQQGYLVDPANPAIAKILLPDAKFQTAQIVTPNYGTQLDSIAESLWAVSMRDESISVNQNGPIWSAKGRMTVG
jgi:hypothetical protein